MGAGGHLPSQYLRRSKPSPPEKGMCSERVLKSICVTRYKVRRGEPHSILFSLNKLWYQEFEFDLGDDSRIH